MFNKQHDSLSLKKLLFFLLLLFSAFPTEQLEPNPKEDRPIEGIKLATTSFPLEPIEREFDFDQKDLIDSIMPYVSPRSQDQVDKGLCHFISELYYLLSNARFKAFKDALLSGEPLTREHLGFIAFLLKAHDIDPAFAAKLHDRSQPIFTSLRNGAVIWSASPFDLAICLQKELETKQVLAIGRSPPFLYGLSNISPGIYLLGLLSDPKDTEPGHAVIVELGHNSRRYFDPNWGTVSEEWVGHGAWDNGIYNKSLTLVLSHAPEFSHIPPLKTELHIQPDLPLHSYVLCHSIKSGDFAAFKAIIRRNSKVVNPSDSLSYPPLYAAAHQGDPRFLRYLLKKGADPAVIYSQDIERSVVHCAAIEGHLKHLRILSEYNAPFNYRTTLNMTALHEVIYEMHTQPHTDKTERQLECVRFLASLYPRPDLEALDRSESSTLLLAVQGENKNIKLRVIKILLDAGANPSGNLPQDNRPGYCPFTLALYLKEYDATRLMLSYMSKKQLKYHVTVQISQEDRNITIKEFAKRIGAPDDIIEMIRAKTKKSDTNKQTATPSPLPFYSKAPSQGHAKHKPAVYKPYTPSR